MSLSCVQRTYVNEFQTHGDKLKLHTQKKWEVISLSQSYAKNCCLAIHASQHMYMEISRYMNFSFRHFHNNMYVY